MNIKDIIVNSLGYPISDDEGITSLMKLSLILVLAVIIAFLFIGIDNFVDSGFYMPSYDLPFSIVGIAGLGIAGLFVFAFELVAYGYCISVMKEGIDQSGSIPSLDLGKNIIDSIKLLVISFGYFLIPAIITAVMSALLMLSGNYVMAGVNYSYGGYSFLGFTVMDYSIMYSFVTLRFLPSHFVVYIASFISNIIYFIFGLLFVVATLRFANYGSLSEAFSISEVWNDLKDIGILKIIIALVAIAMVISIIIAGSLYMMSISSICIFLVIMIVLPFVLLFGSYAMGLLYSEVA